MPVFQDEIWILGDPWQGPFKNSWVENGDSITILSPQGDTLEYLVLKHLILVNYKWIISK